MVLKTEYILFWGAEAPRGAPNKIAYVFVRLLYTQF